MEYDRNFLGLNGFVWFTGVVEDREDPEKLGRMRVRCVGFHTQDKTILPTEDLPWAQVILPITSAGISGLGVSPSFVILGSWVVGYFRDGDMCQEPVVFGTLPGKPKNLDTGVKVAGEVDTNRLAVNDEEIEHASYTERKEYAEQNKNIPTADFDATTDASGGSITASDSETWNHPAILYFAKYPYNHVMETESGHIKEFDDSPGWERIHERHKTGTGYEIDTFGNKTSIYKDGKYDLIEGKAMSHFKSSKDITIDGRHKLFINKSGSTDNHYDIHIGPNANVNIQVDTGNINLVTKEGKVNVNAGGDYNVKVGGNYTLSVAGNKAETIEGTKTSNTSGAVIHRGSTIDLNP